jgi:hypothetical protein
MMHDKYSHAFALAVRSQLGLPLFRPANDAICFAGGVGFDLEKGQDLARLAMEMRKDIVYVSWPKRQAKQPTKFVLVYRGRLTIDVIEDVVPYAANEDAPVTFVNARGDEHFCLDERGSLTRCEGVPKNLRQGTARAMRQMRANARHSGRGLPIAQWVPPGGAWIEPETKQGAAVCFR